MKILKKISFYVLLLTVIIGLVLTGLWLVNAPANLAENSASKIRLDLEGHKVKRINLEMVDSERETPALGKFKGSKVRTLDGSMWYPEASSGQFPLIVYSHGFGGYHKDSTYLTEFVAKNGYVVAGVDFPLSNARSPAGVPQLLDVVNQPGDVSRIIDHIIALNSDPDSPLYNRVDLSNIGAMGLSLGGLTTALVSFHPDLMDERIKTAVMMAPPLEAFSNRFFETNRDVNSLLISGSMDRVVPEPANAIEVMARQAQGWFISMDRGTHLGFADIANTLRWMENPDNLGCTFMAYMLNRLELPERWDAVIPNTNSVLRDVEVSEPCPDLSGKSMNGLKQQWLTQLAITSFFDMNLKSGAQAQAAYDFFNNKLALENPEIVLTAPD